jgi:hypothetical protein
MKVGFKLDLNDKKTRSLLNKMKKGAMVQVPKDALSEPHNVFMDVKDETASKIRKALRSGKGVRMMCCKEESDSMMGDDMEFTEGGRIKVKSLKQLNRESARNLKKAGKELKKTFTKTIPEGYKSKVRKYTSPFFKGALQYAIPEAGSQLVGSFLDVVEAPEFVKKTVQAGTKAGLKPLATKAYRKSGLGLRVPKMHSTGGVAMDRRIPKMPVKTLPRSIAVNDMDMGMGLYAGATRMGMGMCMGGRMPRSAGGAIRYKDISIGDQKLPPIVMGGAVNMGSLIDINRSAYSPYQGDGSTPMMPLNTGKGLF